MAVVYTTAHSRYVSPQLEIPTIIHEMLWIARLIVESKVRGVLNCRACDTFAKIWKLTKEVIYGHLAYNKVAVSSKALRRARDGLHRYVSEGDISEGLAAVELPSRLRRNDECVPRDYKVSVVRVYGNISILLFFYISSFSPESEARRARPSITAARGMVAGHSRWCGAAQSCCLARHEGILLHAVESHTCAGDGRRATIRL